MTSGSVLACFHIHHIILSFPTLSEASISLPDSNLLSHFSWPWCQHRCYSFTFPPQITKFSRVFHYFNIITLEEQVFVKRHLCLKKPKRQKKVKLCKRRLHFLVKHKRIKYNPMLWNQWSFVSRPSFHFHCRESWKKSPTERMRWFERLTHLC